MSTYTSKNGLLGITDDVSGGYSSEVSFTCNARLRNAELKLVLDDCLSMTKRIAELEKGYEELQVATLNAIQLMSGGQAKSDLRDAYDKATHQLEALGGAE